MKATKSREGPPLGAATEPQGKDAQPIPRRVQAESPTNSQCGRLRDAPWSSFFLRAENCELADVTGDASNVPVTV